MGRKSRLKRERRQARIVAEVVLAGARRTACERFEKVIGFKPDLTITTPPGEAKMSDTLLDFAEPLIDMMGPTRDARTLEGVLALATAIWNAHLLGGDAEEDVLEKLRESLIDSGFPANLASGLLEEMLARRRDHFGHDRRLVGSYSVVENPRGGLHVMAAYVASSQQKQFAEPA